MYTFILRPCAPRFIRQNPVIPSSLRAWTTAANQPPCLFACPFFSIFLDTTLPLLFRVKSSLVNPPSVNLAVPFHTLRYDPVCIFRVTRLGFLTCVRRTARFALGALGFWARVALTAIVVVVSDK